MPSSSSSLLSRPASAAAAAAGPSPAPPLHFAREYHDSDFPFEEHAKAVEEARGSRRKGAAAPSPLPAYARDAAAQSALAWHRFHSRHAGRFFHPRLYLFSVFPELASLGRASVLEVGCGNGSNVFPLLEMNPEATVYASDVTPAALRTLLRGGTAGGGDRGGDGERPVKAGEPASPEDAEVPLSASSAAPPRPADPAQPSFPPRLVPFLFDVVTGSVPASVPGLVVGAAAATGGGGKMCAAADTAERAAALTALHASFAALPPAIAAGGGGTEGVSGGGMDAVLLTFVLSALPPSDHPAAVRTLFRTTRPGGLVFFRDYGLYDLAQLRMEEGVDGAEDVDAAAAGTTVRLGARLFRRGDGTLSYFFAREEAVALFEGAGFEAVDVRYATVQNVNRKKGVVMRRVFVSGRFRKPAVG